MVKKEKEFLFKKMVEREFLNYKGLLIDMYGLGSVFYMIWVCEKIKVKGFDFRDKRKNKYINNKFNENEYLYVIKVF